MNTTTGIGVLEGLIDAVNRHDLDDLVGTFSDDVRSDTPAHPARSFVGRDQVRRNWSQILGAIGDLRATIVTSTTGPGQIAGGEAVWAELAFDGHRPDGAPWRMRGVTINQVVDGRITDLHFYMEPLDEAAVDVGTSIRGSVGPGPALAAGPAAPAAPAAGAAR
jgi:ketosteroid isomerase-like protein